MLQVIWAWFGAFRVHRMRIANFWSWKQNRTRDRERSYSELKGPYIDNPFAHENWLREYYQEIEETERRKQNLENPFDGTEARET